MTQTQKKTRAESQDNYVSILPLLKRKYLTTLVIVAVVILLIPSYMSFVFMVIAYAFLTFIALVSYGLYRDFLWQKVSRKLRPFIVAKVNKYVSSIFAIYAIGVSIISLLTAEDWIPHIIFWLLCLAIPLQFFQVFRLAHNAKEKYPDRCEFC